MKRRNGWTLIEMLVALTVAALLILLGMQVLLAVLQVDRRSQERDMLEEQLSFGLAQIAEDAAISYAVSDGSVFRPGNQSLPKSALYFLQTRSSHQSKPSDYFGENGSVMVEYALKVDEYKPPQGAPPASMVLYRAEHFWVRSNINRKEPVALFLNRDHQEKVPGLSVRGFDQSGRVTSHIENVAAIEVTLAGKLRNNIVVQKSQIIAIGNKKGAGTDAH